MIPIERIWNSAQLPTLPAVAVRLLDIVRDPESEIRDVVETIKLDPAISAKLVKAANASYFGVRSEVKAMDRAVSILGTTVATSLALSFSLTDESLQVGPRAEHYKNFWVHSVVQAATAELIGQRLEPAQRGEYFLTGLLLELGRLAMLKTIPNEYMPVLEEAKLPGPSLAELEQEHLGFSHVQIGQQMMTVWKLPEGIVHAAAFHHAPLEKVLAFGSDPESRLLTAMALSAASADYFCTSNKGLALHSLREISSTCLGMGEDDLVVFLKSVEERCHQAGELFNVNLSQLQNSADLMIQANEQLVQLALREHVASTQASIRQHVAEQEKRELESRNRELQQQAMHDPLTGAHNRKFFDEVLMREVHRCVRAAQPLAVVFIDVDHFKSINDTYGHQFGDQVLKRISQIFTETIRVADTLARFGGEEFVVLVSQPSEKGVERLAERIRENVAKENFRFGSTPVKVTVSVGSAIAIPRRGETGIGERLIAVADECLYEAKRGGRNRTVIRHVMDERDRQLQQLITQTRFSRWLVQQRLVDVPSISRILLDCQTPHVQCGELAVRMGYLDIAELHSILKHQEVTGDRFCSVAVRLGLMTATETVFVLATQLEDPRTVVGAIVRAGLLAPDTATGALEDFTRTVAPPPKHRVMSLV
ncbi:MAG: hypothetical protein C0478_13510 [Planctomyces sp.]|nr:hypothetical protein [Planctomyces sp.]